MYEISVWVAFFFGKKKIATSLSLEES